MISKKTINCLEFEKVLCLVQKYAVLDKTKNDILELTPISDYTNAKKQLDITEEAYKLLFNYSIGGVFYFADVSDSLKRADMGGVLNNSELLKVCDNLKSARLLKNAVQSISDESIVELKEVSSRLITNIDFEKEIEFKIISEDEISDNASTRLLNIRKNIRELNIRIKEKLNSYIRGYGSKFLQDSVVTMRFGRYVIPVKSEYRSEIKGFIHDQSSSGATVFIEPEAVMNSNNELKKALFDEQDEIHNILLDLSSKVVSMSDSIRYNYENLVYIDSFFARAQYSFYNKCNKPKLNNVGEINIINGRHPLINFEKVVPISFYLGKDFNFLLLTGPNTGGKTVTLKLTGLFCLMAMCGIFINADSESLVSTFTSIFADIGDEQSIEQNLSTFSSHFKNLINIINNLDSKSLVLIDEIGAGTDPEEGNALATAIIEKLLKEKCFGIITTHYSKLKIFASKNPQIQNACMEFNAETLQPLYKINIGIPGSSNAIEIAKTLGLNDEIINRAYFYLDNKQISYEEILKKAEENRRKYEELITEQTLINKNKNLELSVIDEEKQKIQAQREKITLNAKNETKRIISDKLAEAEEIIDELKNILKEANLESKEVIRASELKNRLENSKYLNQEIVHPYELNPIRADNIKVGNKVYVKSLGGYAEIISLKEKNKEAIVLFGDIKSTIKFNDMYNLIEDKKNTNIAVQRKIKYETFSPEINVIGKTSLEAIDDLEYLLDKAIINNATTVKIIHGVGEGVLLKAIREYLKKDKRIKEFRRGNYGEGENGVTIITLK